MENMDSVLLPYICMMVIPVLIAVAYLIIRSINEKRYLNSSIQLRQLTAETKALIDALKDCSIRHTKEQYKKYDKEIYTKKGEFRVAFKKDANTYLEQVKKECLDGNVISSELLKYAKNYHTEIKVKDLEELIFQYMNYRSDLRSSNLEAFVNQVRDITPEEFFQIKPMIKGDVVGVYIIHNQTNGMYYVGQAKRVYFRINQHFTGSGNGDVYADYKYGNDFGIRIIKLSDSGYSDIDKLERDLIEKYDSYKSGYNKTGGNS